MNQGGTRGWGVRRGAQWACHIRTTKRTYRAPAWKRPVPPGAFRRWAQSERMTMKAYHVKGTFQMGINKQQPFTLECAAKDEQAAREYAFSDLGSRHAVVRRLVKIESVEEQPLDQVGNPRVRYLVERGA